ncbi:hypothetical protein [Prosthecobacter sp.]
MKKDNGDSLAMAGEQPDKCLRFRGGDAMFEKLSAYSASVSRL